MEKTIKYLENGEYHYATVRDVGDLAKLKTDSKDDLVTAINELFITGGEGPKKPDGYDELVDNVADAIQKQQQMTDTITNMQQSAQLSDAEMQHMKQVQEEAHQDYIKALKEFNDAIAQANADALELDKKTDELKKNADDLNKKTNDLQDKLNETFTNVGNEVSAVHKQLDTESAGLHKELNDTKTSLEETRKDLLNNTQEFGVVNSEVKELKDKMDRRIWSTDLDPVREQVNKNTTEVSQTKDELKNKADQSNLDLVTNSVENLSTQVKENAAGLKVSVKKDELGGDVARLLNDKTNLLLGTRNFSGDNWSNKTHWHEEPGYWKGLKVFSSTKMWSGLQYKYEVKQGQQYTFSFWARQEKDNSSASIVLSESDKGDQGIATPYVRGVHIETEWKRYSLTFQAESDGIIYPRVEQNVQGNKLYIAGYKLELGSVATPWEPNEADIAENIEHNESQFNVYSDQIAGIVKKQEKMGDTERQLDTRITETAEGLKQTSKDLQDANGKITEFKGQLESTARGLKTEYEKYTNDAIGQISDSSLNLIRNSAFQNKDDQFGSWQNVSSKATVRTDSNDLHWVELVQSGQSTDNPISVTSNYFIVKQGKVTVAVDVKLGDKANLDNQNILLLELYNDNKQRVDFTDVSVSQLGLSTAILNDHNIHRGLYRLGIDRKDVKYMTVKAILHRNGDLWFTNFSARLSSIDDGGYTPNPDDVNQQILKQNTKIEQDAKQIALKANSVDVTRDIKSAVDGIRVGGRNLANGTDKEYTMGYGIPNTTWQNGYAYESLPTKILTGEILPLNDQFFANLVPGQEYTQTIWFETDADVKKLNAAITWFTNVGHDEQPAKIIKVGENSYKLFSTYIWPGKTDNNVRLFDIFYLGDAFDLSTGTYLRFGKLKLEEGNVSTDWTPSLQDTSEEIKSAKEAAIQVASDQINLHVNELSTSFDDKLNKRVNEVKTASEKFTSDGIEQVVTKITNVKNDVDRLGDTVDGIQVGGRNYLQNSDKSITGWAQDLGTIPNATLNELAGKTITVSADVEWNNFKSDSALQNRLGFELTVSGSDGRGYWLGAWKYPKTSSGKERISTTYTLPQGVTFTVVNNGQNGYVSINGSGKVSHVKIEIGNRMTDWSPAPEDINQSIKDATEYKTVTGTIDFNNLKTQQKIFYKDVQATNAPAGGNYWYYLDVEPGTDGRIFQTAISDRDNITWVRTFVDGWSPWIKQADQRNVDDLNNQISSFKTETTASVKNLGDRVTTEVNSVETRVNNKIDGIQVGGVNLVAGTNQKFTMFYCIPDTIWKDNSAYLSLPTKVTGDEILPRDDRPFHLVVEKGKTYTQTIWIETDASIKDLNALQFTWFTSDGHDFQPAKIRKIGDKQYKLYSTYTWPGKKDNGLRLFDTYRLGSAFDIANSGIYLKFLHLQIEYGNQSTDWSPAPEDTIEAIKQLNTKWDVANGQIQGKVTETDVNNILNGKGYATQSWAQSNFRMKSDSIDLEVKKITDPISNKINNLQVGTRNLLHDTSDQWRTLTNGNGWLQKATASSYWTSTSDYHGGDEFTYAAKITNNSHQQAELEVWLFDQNKNLINGQTFHAPIPKGANAYDAHVTFPITVNTWYIRSWIIFTGGHAPNGDSVQVKDERLVEGATPGSWTPNPEDINQQILKMNTKIEEDAEHIALKANSVDVTRDIKSAVDGIDISGVNLLRNTDPKQIDEVESDSTWILGSFGNGSAKVIDLPNSNIFTAKHGFEIYGNTNGNRDFTQRPIHWTNNKYVFSVYARIADVSFAKSVDMMTRAWSNQTNRAVFENHYTLTSKQWTRVTMSIDASSFYDQTGVSLAFGLSGYGSIDFAQPMLELANKASKWSPNPQDTSAEIKSAKDAAIKVASDQINIHVNELTTSFDDKLNKRVNEVKSASEKFTSDGIEQTVKKITDVKGQVDGVNDKVNNIKTGGRNLAVGTSHKWQSKSDFNGGTNVCINIADYIDLSDVMTGDTLQIGITIKKTSGYSGNASWFVQGQKNADGYDWIRLGSTFYNKNYANDQVYKEVSFVTVTDSIQKGQKLKPVQIRFDNVPAGTTFSWKDFYVKSGTTPTDWTPAPEDIDQTIKDATEYKTVTGTIDFNNLKTQQKIFYKDLQATNAPAGGNYWYYLDVEPGTDGRIFQTAISDRDNITWVRTFVDGWSPWVKQADQRNVDDLNNQISSFKTETTASVKNLGDRVTTEVNSVTSKINNVDGKVNNMKIGGRNLLKGTRDFNSKYWYQSGDHTGLADNPTDSSTKEIHSWLDWHSFINNQTIQLEPSKNYMISADITIYDGDGNGLYVAPYGTVDGQTSNLASTDVNLAGFPRQVKGEGFRRIYLPVTAHGRTLKDFRIEGHGNWNAGGGSVFISKIALYEGNTPMAWSDASDDFVEAIKKLNTKWDVANGQIQGKVTATDVNNILNGKGYATQSWAQTMFTMKSDAITLQAVRDNITNGIQNQVNDTRNQVKGLQNQFNTQTGINLLKGTADFSGSWFNKDANGWSIMSGWQAPFSENTSAMNNNVVYVKNGSAWNGLGQAVQLNPGEYTFSMWLWPDLSGKESLSIYAGDGQYGGTATLSCGYTYSASQPQKQWVLAKLYLNVTKGGVVAIRPELNQDTGKMYVASYMLQRGHVENPTWAPNPGDLSPANIVSAINLTPDDIKLASKKINIDGNTSISGTLNVPTVRLQGKSGQIDLSGDSGISIKDSSDGKVDIGASGVNIFSGMQTVNTDFADKSGFKLNVGSSGVEFSNVLHQTNGIMGAGQHEYGFLKIEPAVLPGTNTQETQYNAPSGIIGYVENMPDASLGPMSPGGFLALGSRTRKDTNVNSPVEDKTEIVYTNKALNGWDQGLTIRSQFFIKPQDADHGIRSAWVSWSAWDHGEKYPAFVNDSGAWGGICFPRSGRVTLFDSGGQYYTPDRSTGVGPYDNYWTKGQ